MYWLDPLKLSVASETTQIFVWKNKLHSFLYV